jgi:hypothetical protein
MVSRDKVGMRVAGVGAAAGVLSADIYTAVIIMVIVTTLISPLWLNVDYRCDPPEPAIATEKEEV